MSKVPSSASASNSITFGSSFWDWVQGDHGFLRKFFVGIAAFAVLILLGRYDVRFPAVLTFAVIAGYIIFRRVLQTEDAVRVIVLNPDVPTEISLVLIGKNKFAQLKKSGSPEAFQDSAGNPVYVAEALDPDAGELRFSWIHLTSRWNFLTKVAAFDRLRVISEDSLRELAVLRQIPTVLGLAESRGIVRIYDDTLKKVLSGEDSDDLLSDIKEAAGESLDSSETSEEASE